ncbi:MAG: Crp/Fnr family transcriptional regulator [Eubacterium sp.]
MNKDLAKSHREITEKLTECTLFREMTPEDIWECFNCSKAELVTYEKGEFLFTKNESPQKVLLLVSGSVLLGRDSSCGRREVISTFTDAGDILGAEDLFLKEPAYSCYAQAVRRSRVILLPGDFLLHTCNNVCSYHAKLISNMLYVFAWKTKHQDERLEIMSGGSIRQKIAKMLVIRTHGNEQTPLTMSRERMAEYLNIARPSLSRELMKMKEDGLIRLVDKRIYIADSEAMNELI